MMDHNEKIAKGFLINGLIFVGLTVGSIALNQLLWQSWLDTLVLIAIFGLGAIQFFVNLVLSLVFWKKDRPATAWAAMASGTAVPMVGIMLIYGLTRLFA
jgi:heme/copper-type cytochrome/quinol oxidase subunit 4